MDEFRVLVVADNPLVRVGLATLLADQEDIEVVGQSSSSDLALMIDLNRPDALVWDLGWEPAAALDAMTDVRDAALPVLALLADEDHAANAYNAGARGLLFNNADIDMLASALFSLANGLVVLDAALSSTLLAQPNRTPAAPNEALTPRELEVLALLAEGLPNKSIARQLSISEHTVKFHVNAILSKLNVQSRTEAVVRATRMGLIAL